MSDGKPPLLRAAAILLVAIVGSDLLLLVGRGVLCIVRYTCPADDWRFGVEQTSALLATVIALIFALMQGPKS
jgi:hypothetical protein